MAIGDLIHSVTSIITRATGHSRPHLARGASCFVPFLYKSKTKSRRGKKKVEEEDGVLWRRTILMGDKCDPLAFSGVIHYDCDGNRVLDPSVKSPLRILSLPTNLLNLEIKCEVEDLV